MTRSRILPVGWPSGRIRWVSRAQALRRMAHGDLPTTGGGYTSALHFSDGTRTTGATGWRLLRDGLIERPKHSSVSSPYTLAPSDECPACSNVGGGPLCKAHRPQEAR